MRASLSNRRDVKTDGDRDNVGDDYSHVSRMYAERENTPSVSPRRDFQSAKIYYNNIVRRNVSLLDEKENRLARLRRIVLHFLE